MWFYIRKFARWVLGIEDVEGRLKALEEIAKGLGISVGELINAGKLTDIRINQIEVRINDLERLARNVADDIAKLKTKVIASDEKGLGADRKAEKSEKFKRETKAALDRINGRLDCVLEQIRMKLDHPNTPEENKVKLRKVSSEIGGQRRSINSLSGKILAS